MCKKYKLDTRFHKDRTTSKIRRGKSNKCKMCIKQYHQSKGWTDTAKRWVKNNPDKVRGYSKKYAATEKGKAAIKNRAAIYVDLYREEIYARNREWYRKNKESVLKRMKRYYLKKTSD